MTRTRQDTEYIFNDSIAEIKTSEAGVEMTFEHSKPRAFDLVVGADGLHSRVRAVAFGEEALFTRYLGYHCSIFSIPNYLQLGQNALYYGTVGKKVGIFGRNEREAKASFFFDSPPLEYDRRDVAQQKRLLRERFAGDVWETPRLLQMMDDAPDFYFDSVSQIKMERWWTGRTVLLGDAGYCGSPLSGMGTSMAMVGAYILAGELKEAGGDYRIGFARYEALMRDFVKQAARSWPRARAGSCRVRDGNFG